MKSLTKKSLLLASSVTSCLIAVGVTNNITTVSAAETSTTSESTGNKYEGTYGTCHWYVTNEGVLHIEGGNMDVPSPINNTYWTRYSKDITSVSIDGDVILNKDSENLFSGLENVTKIDNISNLDTTNVEIYNDMFANCKSLTELDLSSFNTDKATSMREMFFRCGGLTSINLKSFNTSNVANFQDMFGACTSLNSLDLSNFDMKDLHPISDNSAISQFLGSTARYQVEHGKTGFKLTLGPNVDLGSSVRNANNSSGLEFATESGSAGDPNAHYNAFIGADGKSYYPYWQDVDTGKEMKARDLIDIYDYQDRTDHPTETHTYTTKLNEGIKYSVSYYAKGGPKDKQLIYKTPEKYTDKNLLILDKFIPDTRNFAGYDNPTDDSPIKIADSSVSVDRYVEYAKGNAEPIKINVNQKSEDKDLGTANITIDDINYPEFVGIDKLVNNRKIDFDKSTVVGHKVSELIEEIEQMGQNDPESYPDIPTINNLNDLFKAMSYVGLFSEIPNPLEINAVYGPVESSGSGNNSSGNTNHNSGTWIADTNISAIKDATIYDNNGNATSETLKNDKDIVISQKMTRNNVTYYRIDDNQWVKATDVYAYVPSPSFVHAFSDSNKSVVNIEGKAVDYELAADTDWRTDRYTTINDVKYYRVASNGFVKTDDVLEYKPIQKVVSTSSIIRLYTDKGKLITNRALDKDTAWKSDETATINGELMYRVATNEWVKASEVLV